MSELRIGISGWTYPPWRGVFYPPDLPQKRELHFASRQLNSIEINGSFYSLQTPASYRKWYDETPEGFVFAMKGGRFITHMRKLKDVRVPLANFFASGVLLLKEKLGPILWQFPPGFAFDEARFEEFFKLLPRSTEEMAKLSRENSGTAKHGVWMRCDEDRPVQYAVEIRHKSFETPAFVQMLRRHKIGLVIADTAGKWPYFEDVTADLVYIRLHGDEELYVSGYTDAALDAWAARIKLWSTGKQPADAKLADASSKPTISKSRDVFVYFDNDVKVRSPLDAINLSKRLCVECGELGGAMDLVAQRPPVDTSLNRDNRWNLRNRPQNP